MSGIVTSPETSNVPDKVVFAPEKVTAVVVPLSKRKLPDVLTSLPYVVASSLIKTVPLAVFNSMPPFPASKIIPPPELVSIVVLPTGLPNVADVTLTA